jgi:hypothetical protein
VQPSLSRHHHCGQFSDRVEQAMNDVGLARDIYFTDVVYCLKVISTGDTYSPL